MNELDALPNKLYELPDDGSAALRAVLDHYGALDQIGLQEALEHHVGKLLADDLVQADVTDAIEGAYEAAIDQDLPEVHGPLGLYLALDAATRASLSGSSSGDALRLAQRRFHGEAMLECFRRYYRLDGGYDLSAARLHRVGTTSLIVECHARRDTVAVPDRIALKCVLPRFLSVKAILKRTEAYRDEHTIDNRELPNAPFVYDSTERTIAMQFIPGRTLAELIEARVVADHLPKEERAQRRPLTKEDIVFLRKVGLAICDGLDALAQVDRRHLDLSPSNIIVENPAADQLRISFIDFGHNFAITDRAGSSAAFRRASLYVAPELIENGGNMNDWRCDAYSLGIILLAIAAKREIHEEDVAGELDRLWKGDSDARWDGVPGLARVVEELIDRAPAQRLALWEDVENSQDPYRYIAGLISQECEVLELYDANTSGTGFGLLRGRGLIRLWFNAQVHNLLETGEAIRDPVDESYQDYPRLARWGQWAGVLWALAIGTAVALTLVSLGISEPPQWLLSLAGASSGDFDFHSFWPDLLGRLAAVTFALTAVTYYVNCFSMLSPKRLGARIGWASEVMMRGLPTALAAPIALTILRPEYWALCAGVGTLLVAVNNFLALCVASEADRLGGRFSTRTPPGNRFITVEFRQWWRQMLIFSLALLTVGGFIVAGLARDGMIYAVLAVVANIWMVYPIKCVARAPELRGSLARDILTLRRAAQLERRGVLAPQEDVVQGPAPDEGRFAQLHAWWWEPLRPRAAKPGVGSETEPEPE